MAGLDVDSELPAPAALADNTANPTVPAVGSFPHVFDGTDWERLRGSQRGGARVQDWSFTGRQELTLHALNVTGVATEALLSMTPVKDFAKEAAVTSYSVPTGKVLVVTSIDVGARVAGTTESHGMSGAPDPASVAEMGISPLANAFPHGIRLPAGAGVGVSHVGNAAHYAISVSVNGYLTDA